MNVPDLIFAVGGLILAAGLLPSVFGPEKPALATSLVTGSIILIYSVTFMAMGLWISGSINLVQSILWVTLAVQESRARGGR